MAQVSVHLELQCPACRKMRCLVGVECEAGICPLLAQPAVFRIELLYKSGILPVNRPLSLAGHCHELLMDVKITFLKTNAFTTRRFGLERARLRAVGRH